MKNIYYWFGVILSSASLYFIFMKIGVENLAFPTNFLFCFIYSFFGGYLILQWNIRCNVKLQKQHQWISFLFPFVGILLAVLSALILNAFMQ